MQSIFNWSKRDHRDMVKGSVALIVASLIVSVINLVYSTYLGRNLDFAEFGLLSLLGSIVNLVQIPLSAYSRAVTHKSAILFGKYNTPVKKFWIRVRGKALIPSIVVVILWIVLIPFTASFFKIDNYISLLLIAPIWAIGIYNAIDGGFLSGSHKFIAVSIMSLSEAVIKLVLTFVFVSFHATSWVYAAIPLSMVISLLIGWAFVLMLKEEKHIELTKKDLQTVSKKFLGSTLLIKLSTVAFLSVDVILAKHFLSPADAGRYALISLIGKMVYFLGALFAQFINPLVSKNIGAGKSSKYVFNLFIPATVLASTVGFLIFGVGAQYVLPFLLGNRVLEVLPYLIPYTFAFGAITISIAIISFHQSLQRHVFAFLSVLAAIALVIAIFFFHDSINEISLSVSVTGIGFLLATIIFHLSVSEEAIMNSTPKKILILNWRDTKHKWAGGAEVYVHELAKSWVKEGKDVTMFCGNDGNNKAKETIDGVKIIRRGGHYTVYLWAAIYYITSLNNKCDVIVESENGIPFFSQLYSNKPVFLIVYHVHQNIFREHLPFPLSHIAMCIEKYFMPLIYRGGRVITISNSTREDLVKLGLAEIEDIDIVNPGIDLSQYKSLPETENPSFIYVGRLKHYKNIDVAIQAFAKILPNYPNATLKIAGYGEMLPDLQKLAKELHLEKSVTFLGKIDDYEKTVLLAKSWVALQPSSVEGWGITVIEANAAGTPVIASKVAGLKDSVIHNETGLLVEVKDVNAWVKAMETLLEDEKKRKHFGRDAKKWSEHFSWANSAKLFLSSIEKRMTI